MRRTPSVKTALLWWRLACERISVCEVKETRDWIVKRTGEGKETRSKGKRPRPYDDCHIEARQLRTVDILEDMRLQRVCEDSHQTRLCIRIPRFPWVCGLAA